MFRDHEAQYLIASVAIASGVIGWLLWHEIAVIDTDSLAETITALVYGVGGAIAVSIFTLAAWEVTMVIAKRLREREREKAHQEGRQEGRQEEYTQWQAWLERMREAQKEGREFNEPAPSERDTGQR